MPHAGMLDRFYTTKALDFKGVWPTETTHRPDKVEVCKVAKGTIKITSNNSCTQNYIWMYPPACTALFTAIMQLPSLLNK